MGRMLVAGFVVLIVGAFMVMSLASEAPRGALAGIATDTPTPTVSASPTGSATATATATAAATGTVTASPAASGTVTASPVQPAAVPVTGGEPSNGTNLALILVIGIGAVAGTAGVLAASYGLTRRS